MSDREQKRSGRKPGNEPADRAAEQSAAGPADRPFGRPQNGSADVFLQLEETCTKRRSGHGSRRPELLIPAANLEGLKTAVIFGADAVYIGGEAFSLRAKAKNFSAADMREGIAFAHRHGAKVYVTVNIFAHGADLEPVKVYLKELSDIRPDGLIIADPGVFDLAKELCPGIERHISTQANNTNALTCRFWHRLGASRIVAARELSLDEIREMRAAMPKDMELEVFIHGAMCISYSGRCLLSSYFTGRDANQGACTHPCRWEYALEEQSRPGEYLPVFENERGTFILNSKDLCMIGHIPELVDAGIDSFKIEGRMRTALYTAAAARTYRRAIDDFLEDPALYQKNMPRYLEQIACCTHREFTTGFFFGKPGADAQIYQESTYIRAYTYLGIVQEVQGTLARIEQKNKFSVGETVEIMRPDGRDDCAEVLSIADGEGHAQQSAPHAKQIVYVGLSVLPRQFDILRRKEE